MVRGKFKTIDGETVVTLPPEAATSLKAKDGEEVCLYETEDGGIRISRDDSEFARQVKAAEQVMREDRDILRALASK